MDIEGYDTKIIGGKLKKIPIYKKDGSQSKESPYPRHWSGFEQPPKIGSKYSIIPPISDPYQDHSSHLLTQQIADLKISKSKIDSVRRLLKDLDSGNGIVTIDELGKVFHLNRILIIGVTFEYLVKRFEKSGGVDYGSLCRFLEDCQDSGPVYRGKLNGQVVPPRLSSLSNNFHDGAIDESRLLQLELEKQLATQTPNLRELKLACEKSGSNSDGTISFREMKDLCYHYKLNLSRSLLERLLNHSDKTRDGSINWRDFLELIERSMPKDAPGRTSVGNRHYRQQTVTKPNYMTLNRSSIQTQTNTGPEPVYVHIGRQKVYVYPPDEYVGVDIPSDPPDERLLLEWVYGYRGRDCRNNLSVLKSGELVYFIAAVVVLFDSREKKQRHYIEHTDDIKSMAVHPDGVTIATGQVEGHESVQGEAHVRIWNSESLRTVMVIGLGYFERAVVSVNFCCQVGIDKGRYLVKHVGILSAHARESPVQ